MTLYFPWTFERMFGATGICTSVVLNIWAPLALFQPEVLDMQERALRVNSAYTVNVTRYEAHRPQFERSLLLDEDARSARASLSALLRRSAVGRISLSSAREMGP